MNIHPRVASGVNEPSPEENLRKLQKYISLSQEIGGSLDHECHVFRLDVEDGSGMMDIFLSPISFHTHPECYYAKTKSIYGWPSDRDIIAALNYRKYIHTHYVIAVEGIYKIEVRDELRTGIELSEDKIKADMIQISEFLKDSSKNSYRRKEPDGLDYYLKSRDRLLKGNDILKISFSPWDSGSVIQDDSGNYSASGFQPIDDSESDSDL